MGGGWFFCVRFSGITVRFDLPEPIALPPAFCALRCEDDATPDDIYQVTLLREPLRPAEPPVCRQGDSLLYSTEQGWLRLYPSLCDRDGCQVACLLRPNGKHTLYYPAGRWADLSNPWQCTQLMDGEGLLLRHDAFLLHSSVVLLLGKTVLFSGPSGAGKSTQADLWHRHLGAKILNGDRCVLRRTEEGFFGGGSLWSGTSGIHHPECAPIAGIFLVEQSRENSVELLKSGAFFPLFSQTTVHSWDSAFMEAVTGLYADLLQAVPVYRLRCRPDEAAVNLAHQTLFGKERPHG